MATVTPTTRSRRRGRRTRGQSLVEFALILPLFLLLLAGMIDFGLGLYSYMTIINAARDGARLGSTACAAATPACSAAISSRVTAGAGGLSVAVTPTCKTSATATPPNATVSCDSGSAKGGGSVTVTVQYTYQMIWPLTFGTSIPMSSASMFMVQ
jgi:Flp pilus assembly protein TadG